MKWREKVFIIVVTVLLLYAVLPRLKADAIHILEVFGILAPTSFTYTYDTATPLGSDAPSVIDDRIREVKASIQERQNTDHYWPTTGTEVSDANAGYHRKVTFRASIAEPSAIANAGFLYMKDFSSTGELCFADEDANEIQLTSNGHLYIKSDATIDVNSFNEADYATGSVSSRAVADGTIATGDILDGTILTGDIGDGTITRADLAADVNALLSYTPETYAGEQSITFPNGLILKSGYTVRSGGSTTITFSAAFTTSCVSFTAVPYGTNKNGCANYTISALSVSAATLITEATDFTGWYWQAVGY